MATYKGVEIDTSLTKEVLSLFAREKAPIEQFEIKYALEPYAAHQMTVAPDIVED